MAGPGNDAIDSHSGCIHIASAAFIIVAVALLVGPPVSAATIEKLAASPAGAESLALPSADTAGWRVRTQLFWNAPAGQLERRTYRLWDPIATEELDFAWTPEVIEDDLPGPISGRGTVTWRLRGAPHYDTKAAVARYQGDMRDGRAHGQGEYLHRSGASYRGDWRDGMMDGMGRLSLPNGDQYVGSFRSGRLHGAGIYIDATGTMYDGSFAEGVRHGEGIVSPPFESSYKAAWRGGSEIIGSRRLLKANEAGHSPLSLTRYQQRDDLRIGLIVERRPTIDELAPPLPYTSESSQEALHIFPDAPRFLDVWRGRTDIHLTDWEEYSYAHFGRSFLGAFGRIKAVPIVFELENTSPELQRIIGAYLDVAESRVDTEPAMHVTVGSFEECGMDAGVTYHTHFHVENFGWSAARNARLKLSFARPESGSTVGEVERELGTISDRVTVDLADELLRLGVNSQTLGTTNLPCPGGDPERCLEQARASGLFGELSDLITLENHFFRVGAVGSLEYQWKDAAGRDHTKRSSFVARLVLGQLEFEPECGEGGDFPPLRRSVFKFDLDRSEYRIAIPLREDVPAGVTARWRMELKADKSSNHAFRVVLQLADGREIASRPISLLYFVPLEPVTD